MPTKLAVALSSGLATGAGDSEHQLELDIPGPDGQGEYRIDGESVGQASWAHVEPGVYSILIGSRSYEVCVARGTGLNEYEVRIGSTQYRVVVRDPRSRRPAAVAIAASGTEVLSAPMPSKVVKLLVREGDEVLEGQGLLVMEAMKMQNELRAPRAGRVQRIHVSEGKGVETGAPLVQLA
jgi:biotin carboxyl carrier protein